MEFALQGRVDRSADFQSAGRVRLSNLVAPFSRAQVILADSSQVSRQLQVGAEGPTGSDVPAGFRVAPLVLRRADIVRFQESQTLARGSIFFDYFPSDEKIAEIRPDDKMRMMEERQFALRLHRDRVIQLLEPSFSLPRKTFEDPASFELWFEEAFGAELRMDFDFQFERFSDEQRELLAELRKTHLGLRVVKAAIEKGVDKLNPIAYKHQRARLNAVLGRVSERLTEAFVRITRADHVRAIEVVVGVSGPISLDTVVEFGNGQKALPAQVFSEGYRAHSTAPVHRDECRCRRVWPSAGFDSG